MNQSIARDSYGLIPGQMQWKSEAELVADRIAGMTFADKREAWCDWQWARKTPYGKRTTLNYRAWLLARVEAEVLA